MNDADRAEAQRALYSALITEAVSVGALMAVWALLRYRTEISHLIWRARTRGARRAAAADVAVADLRAAISRWEHEQRRQTRDTAPGSV